MSSFTFYDFPGAYHPAKPRLLLIEKNLTNYRRQIVNVLGGDSLRPWFMRINPKSWVPTLVMKDGRVLIESKDIVKYLDQLDTRLGRDGVEPHVVDQWVDRCSEWDGNLYIFANADRNMKGLMQDLSQYKVKFAEKLLKKHPDLATAYTDKIKSIKSTMIIDTAAVKANDEVLKDLLTSAEATLKNQPFLAGTSYSLADVMLTVVLWRIGMVAGKHAELVEPLPAVCEYFKRMQQRPSYSRAFGEAKSVPFVLGLVGTVLKVKLAKVTNCY